ncbi:MAG TPA: hypothetical protein VLQ90_04355 [Pyrinomonadaceae bacterium]|nr:hypothetical protein [Pyrinomonadaceae bacterium]
MLAISGGLAQETCKRDVEAGFSVCVPEGWSVETQPDQKFKAFFAPKAEIFTANINMRDDPSNASFMIYVGQSIKQVLSNPPSISATNIKLVGWVDFATAAGVNGNKAIFETEFKGLLIRTVQYYIDGGTDRKFIVTGTCLVKDKDTFDSVFERAAKTFRVEN